MHLRFGRDIEPPAAFHRLRRIGHEVDDHLLQFARIDGDKGGVRGLGDGDGDLGLRQDVIDQNEAVAQHLAKIHIFLEAAEFGGARELQELADDGADAAHLAVDQPQFMRHRRGALPEGFADHVEIALDHRRGVVDLMRHACRDLADGGELFGHDELLIGALELGIGGAQLGGALLDPRVQLLVPGTQRAVALLHLVEQAVEMGSHRADLVARRHGADPRLQIARLDPRHGGRHPLQRCEDGAREPQEDRHADRQHRKEGREDQKIGVAFGGIERGLEIAHIKHPDPAAETVQDRTVGRDIPVVDDKGAVEPGAPLAQHRRPHRRRDAGAERAGPLEQPHIGRDAHILQKQRRRALPRARRAAVAVDQRIDRVDEIEIAVEQDAPHQHPLMPRRGDRRGAVHDHAAILDGAGGGHGRARLDQRHARPLGQGRAGIGQGGKGFGREDVDLGQWPSGQRRGDHRPVARGGVAGPVIEEIEAERRAFARQEGGQVRRIPPERPVEAQRARQRRHIAPGRRQDALHILIGDPQIGFDIGDEQRVVIGRPPPDGQRQKRGHQHHERQKREDEQA